MNAICEIVRISLATYANVDVAEVTLAKRIADLRLRTIDLVWVAMQVEAVELGAGEFPVEKLDAVETVGDLITAFEDWAAQRDTFEEIDVLDVELRHGPRP
jgi:hypothetical protein